MKSLSQQENGRFLSLAALFDGNFCLDWVIDITGHKASEVLCVLEEATRSGWLEKQERVSLLSKTGKFRNHGESA